jgi:GNAT superfamily N-acetyltransferase
MEHNGNNPIGIARAREEDLQELLVLYKQLHETDPVPAGDDLQTLWQEILKDPRYHILIVKAGGEIVASVTVVIIKNLTRDARPYAIIENVITDAQHRKQGYAAELMAQAVQIAKDANCYKVSLTTGSKDEATLRFYERCGFNRQDKTAFIRWLTEI